MPRRISRELRGVVHRPFRSELGQIRQVRPDEHVPDEERLPCVRGDEAHREPIAPIGAAEKILHEHFRLIVQVLLYAGQEQLELRRRHLLVLLPPDLCAGSRLIHQELVLRAPSRMRRGDGREGAAIAQEAFLAPDRLLDQLAGAEVGSHSLRREPMRGEGGGLRAGRI